MDMGYENGHMQFIMYLFFWRMNTNISYTLKGFIIEKENYYLNGSILDLDHVISSFCAPVSLSPCLVKSLLSFLEM